MRIVSRCRVDTAQGVRTRNESLAWTRVFASMEILRGTVCVHGNLREHFFAPMKSCGQESALGFVLPGQSSVRDRSLTTVQITDIAALSVAANLLRVRCASATRPARSWFPL
jgi:hypothetical protein